MKKKYLKYGAPVIIVLILAGVIAAALIVGGDETKTAKTKVKSQKTAQACGNYRNDGQVVISDQVINVEIPRNHDEFTKGLGGRPCILPNEGMLFGYTKPGQYAFWMKGMKFPIDIAWISADKRVVGLEVDVQPSTYPDKFINKDKPAQYVLELKAFRSQKLHVGLGTTVGFNTANVK